MDENSVSLMETVNNESGCQYELNAVTWDSSDINISPLLRRFNKDSIDDYINDPMQYHKELCEVCEVMFNSHGIFAQTVAKMTAAPTLDYVLIPSVTQGAPSVARSGKSTAVSAEAMRMRDEAESLIKELNHTLLTRDSLFSHLMYGESVYILQTKTNGTGSSRKDVMLKPLNRSYVRFEGTSRGDHIVSFDLSFFDDEASEGMGDPVDILATYPLEFIEAYARYKNNSEKRWFALPQETTFATKFRAGLNERHGRPLALAAITDMMFAYEYLESQRDNLQKYSSELLYIVQPEGEKKGMCSITNAQQAAQFSSFKNAVRKQTDRANGYSPQATTLALAAGTKIDRLAVNPDLLKETLKKENNEQIASDLGLGLGAISGSGGAGNYASLSLNMDLVLSEVYQYLEQAHRQYEKIINAYLKTDAGSYVKFRYLKTSNMNRKEAFANAKELYMISGGSRIWLYAAAMGDSRTYLDLMEFEQALGYDKKFLPHVTSFTATDRAKGESPDGNTGGRPEKDVSDMTDKGLGTRTDGSNEGIKPGMA